MNEHGALLSIRRARALFGARHAFVYVGNNGGFEEEAGPVYRFTAGDDAPASGDRAGNLPFERVAQVGTRARSELRLRIHRIADALPRGFICKRANKTIVDAV